MARISGEAGIGKSRLLRQFLSEAEGAGWRTLLVRFFEQDAHLPYAGIVRLLDNLIADGTTARLLKPFTRDLSLVSPEAARLVDLENGGEGPRPDGESDKLRFLQAFAKSANALCADCPTVIAFEDIHWADASSLETLLYVARESSARLLVLLTFRSEEDSAELRAVFTELERERVSAEIGLIGLGLRQVDSMLKACLNTEHSTRADVLYAIHQLTNGNPFFVEEVTRSLVDGAGTARELSSLRLADFDLPRGLNEAVRKRTHDLSDAARELLVPAAVAGVRFDLPLLEETAGRKTDELLVLLKELVAAQLVVEESEDSFAFRHALTREAIRSDLLRRERRDLSLRIGQAIERLYAGDEDNRLEDLSWHFYEAGEWPKAFDYSLRAGKRAMSLYAPGSALTHLNRAIEAGGHLAGADLTEAMRLRGSAHEATGDFDAARIDYETASAETARDPKERWRALLDLGLLWAARDYARTEPYLREALTLARELGDPAAVAHSLNRLGNWYSNVGDMDGAQAMSEEALAIFREQGDEAGVAQTLDLLGITCTLGMRFEQAVAYYREAISRLEQLDDRRTLVSALASIQIGSSTNQTNMVPPALSLEEASAFGQRALAIAREMGWKADEAYALWQLAQSTSPQGEGTRALAYALEALAIARDIGHTQWEAGAECAVGSALTDLLATDEARVHLNRAMELGREMNSGLWLGQSRAMLIDVLLTARATKEALSLYEDAAVDGIGGFGPRELFSSGTDAVLASGDLERAFSMLDRLEAEAARSGPGKALRLQRTRGRALVAAGNVEAGIEMMEVARTGARVQGNVVYEWQISAELAHAYLVRGDREQSRTAANEAIDLIDKLASRVDDDDLRRNFLERAMELLPGTMRRRIASSSGGLLSARGQEIAHLVSQGLTSREIADRLVLSSRTVESHVANAMAKLGFTTRSQLAAWAAENRATRHS